MNRKDKIKLLKSIAAGSIKMKELKMLSAGNLFIIVAPGVYRGENGELYCQKEINEMKESNRHEDVLIFLPDNGRDKIPA